MLTLVTEESAIIEYQELLETTLKTALSSTKTVSLGTPNGTFDIELNYNSDIWFGTFEQEIWYWNSFGLFNELDFNRTNKILLEINIKISELSKHGGGFAIDENGDVLLFHRGNLNHLKKRFLAWNRKNKNQSLKIIDDGKKGEEVIVIGSIASKDFIENFTAYVKNVSLFRKLVSEEKREAILHEDENHEEVESSSDVSVNSLLRDIENADLEKIERIIFVPKRNQTVVREAKEFADGECQLCGCDAPFENEEGESYLEVHHVKWLSQGGADCIENAVALCPNCHRKMHILNLAEDVAALEEIAALQW